MGFVRIEKPVEEGDKSECVYCGIPLIGRLTDYKGKFRDYLQWQSVEERKSHYLKDGGCKNDKKTESTIPNESKSQNKGLSVDEKIDYLTNKIDLIFSMLSEQFRDYQDRKLQS